MSNHSDIHELRAEQEKAKREYEQQKPKPSLAWPWDIDHILALSDQDRMFLALMRIKVD